MRVEYYSGQLACAWKLPSSIISTLESNLGKLNSESALSKILKFKTQEASVFNNYLDLKLNTYLPLIFHFKITNNQVSEAKKPQNRQNTTLPFDGQAQSSRGRWLGLGPLQGFTCRGALRCFAGGSCPCIAGPGALFWLFPWLGA